MNFANNLILKVNGTRYMVGKKHQTYYKNTKLLPSKSFPVTVVIKDLVKSVSF